MTEKPENAAHGRKGVEVRVLERGSIYFLYRPKVEHETVESVGDVQRFHVVLHPDGQSRYRLLVIGAKRLAAVDDARDRNWGFVDAVAERPEEFRTMFEARHYETKTRGQRTVPAVRPAGEGVYAIAMKGGDHTHLAYVLELPKSPGEVQDAFNIEPEASFILTVKNPEAPPTHGSAAGARGAHREPDLPRDLKARFDGRRFVPCDPPSFLDHEGVEFVLIGAGEDIGTELGIDMPVEEENETGADILRDLKLSRSDHPIEPLIKGDFA